MRSQQGTIPGNMERVISLGMSGGGGMSLILGTSGDSPLYEPYLEAIGMNFTVEGAHFLEGDVFGKP